VCFGIKSSGICQYKAHGIANAAIRICTALNHILETMVRWLAPVLSFTAEEIWQSMPDEKNDSIFLQEWYQVLDASYSNICF
jgi:isoleucyl-tRNA synthetase